MSTTGLKIIIDKYGHQDRVQIIKHGSEYFAIWHLPLSPASTVAYPLQANKTTLHLET